MNATICKEPPGAVVRVCKSHGNLGKYSQLSPRGHHTITDTLIIRTAAKSPAKIEYRRVTEINSRYYGLSLLKGQYHAIFSNTLEIEKTLFG